MAGIIERDCESAAWHVDDELTGGRAVEGRECGDDCARAAATRLRLPRAALVNAHDGVPFADDVDELDVHAFRKREHIDVRHRCEIERCDVGVRHTDQVRIAHRYRDAFEYLSAHHSG